MATLFQRPAKPSPERSDGVPPAIVQRRLGPPQFVRIAIADIMMLFQVGARQARNQLSIIRAVYKVPRHQYVTLQHVADFLNLPAEELREWLPSKPLPIKTVERQRAKEMGMHG